MTGIGQSTLVIRRGGSRKSLRIPSELTRTDDDVRIGPTLIIPSLFCLGHTGKHHCAVEAKSPQLLCRNDVFVEEGRSYQRHRHLAVKSHESSGVGLIRSPYRRHNTTVDHRTTLLKRKFDEVCSGVRLGVLPLSD